VRIEGQLPGSNQKKTQEKNTSFTKKKEKPLLLIFAFSRTRAFQEEITTNTKKQRARTQMKTRTANFSLPL
jgi:hypothetical protein